MVQRCWRGSTSAAVALALPLAAGLLLATPGIGRADVCSDAVADSPLSVDQSPCADVLRQEARWLKAITDGDRGTIEAILDPNYKHITSEGVLINRAQEVAGTVAEPFTMNPSEQIVDIAGDTAVIHGINTVIAQDGTVLARERFTDVFVLKNGQWMAISAQETAY